MLEQNVPSDATQRVKSILMDRLPNYCKDCGSEIVIAGGRLEPEDGWYEHLDPVVTCERACWQRRFTMGVDQEEGQEYRVGPGSENHDELFRDVRGYCDIHDRQMKVTKDLTLTVDGEYRPVRQHKCPDCDMESPVTVRE